MKEKWKRISDYKNYYITEFGKVKNIKTKRILKHIISNSGYPQITLYKNGIRQNYVVHTLVTKTFLGKKPKRYIVNHKDGNKLNNHYSNLEYVTYSENVRHANRIGLVKMPKGSKHYRSKIAENDIKFIRNYKGKQKNLCLMFGLSKGQVSSIRSKRFWKHVR